jgi:sulfur relay (sulfurtransferase) complex TusBCD TusD component (DsrE family)
MNARTNSQITLRSLRTAALLQMLLMYMTHRKSLQQTTHIYAHVQYFQKRLRQRLHVMACAVIHSERHLDRPPASSLHMVRLMEPPEVSLRLCRTCCQRRCVTRALTTMPGHLTSMLVQRMCTPTKAAPLLMAAGPPVRAPNVPSPPCQCESCRAAWPLLRWEDVRMTSLWLAAFSALQGRHGGSSAQRRSKCCRTCTPLHSAAHSAFDVLSRSTLRHPVAHSASDVLRRSLNLPAVNCSRKVQMMQHRCCHSIWRQPICIIALLGSKPPPAMGPATLCP